MITVSNLTKSYGGQVLYQGGSFFIGPGEKVGLVGPNGAGKTSLFRLLMGEERADSGSVNIPDKLKVCYFSQSVGELKGRSALEEVIHGNPRLGFLKTEISKIEKVLEDGEYSDQLLEKLGDYQTEFEKLGGYDIEYQAAEVLTGLGIMPDEHQRPVENFSGGWKMRIALAKVLAQRPEFILMDEPTNYLDLESILWLETWLKNFKGAVFMTSHDRDFMNGIVKKIVEVNHRTITVYSGNYDFYEKERNIRREQLVASSERQQAMLQKEEEFIAKFAARASHAAQVQSRVKKLDKIDKIELPPEEQTISFEFPKPPRSGNDVVKMDGLAKVWVNPEGKEKKVFSSVSGLVKRLERVAVVGVNGAGKSTLLKIIAGLVEPTQGKVDIGANVEIGYFSQYSMDVLNPQKTVFEEVRDRVKDKSDGFMRNLLAAFLFKGDDVEKKVSVLSGGEKSRLILATLLTNPCNLLILDEPTNHLDIRSREVLTESLKSYEGTLMIVSHDRHFLKQLTTQVAEVDKGGVRFYPGTYNEYLASIGDH
ncbi:MAG TPA: ABC-F family ATP-binding cassette domain-containing protein [Bacteriovoracaceae bacterium]|nr:ABC-F family ATP-binding cassette domain-containing protein [Bacteriovoracaceae bacterium]